MAFLAEAGSLFMELFEYNRGNFKYDRRQRQIMEYELMSLKNEQVGLWREDVRNFMVLTPQKMEVYLMIIALELGFCVMGLCKARVPPGAPPWIVGCHTLSVCGALVYLFLALWFGMQAFVSAQAYKVRILTQLVRLPIPTWASMEAATSYASAFEKMKGRQMLRVPFAMGTQEQHVRPGHAQHSEYQGPTSPSGGAERLEGSPSSAAAEDSGAVDPWGLERSGDNILELHSDVNTALERQRHIWLVREAAKFYQTYDAFCRISMSAGTCCLATFFCYYCMTYVLTENAAPVGCWAGMLVFISCALWLLRTDLLLTGRQYFIQGFCMLASPVLSFIVTYKSSKTAGNPGSWTFIIVVAFFLHGVWLLYYLVLFRIREMQTGALLPTAFKRVLFIDPFGWGKHTATWWKRLKSMPRSRSGIRHSLSSSSWTSLSDGESEAGNAKAPAMQCVNSSAPKRPEDVEEAQGSYQAHPEELNVSFRPGTFAGFEKEPGARGEVQTGADIHGEKPGVVPYRVFFIITVTLAMLWWIGAALTLVSSFQNNRLFSPFVDAKYRPLRDGEVRPIPELLGHIVATNWDAEMIRPRGLACDPSGTRFLTASHASNGHRQLLQGQLSPGGDSGFAVRFGSAQACAEMEKHHGPIQDIALHGCEGASGCTAVVLPQEGTHLVSCPLRPAQGTTPEFHTLPLGRSWLSDRGGIPLDDGATAGDGYLHPEELSAIHVAPCSAHSPGKADCVIAGTTARRVVQLGVGDVEDGGSTWVPQRLLNGDHEEVPGPGSFALLGDRYLGTLNRNTSQLEVTDLHQGGNPVASLAMPHAYSDAGAQWASICAGGGALYALDDGEDPTLWRFALPTEFAAGSDGPAAAATARH